MERYNSTEVKNYDGQQFRKGNIRLKWFFLATTEIFMKFYEPNNLCKILI